MEMTHQENIIKALECRLDINGSKYKHCLTCIYRHDIDHCQWACQTDGILEDALTLIKAQEPVKPVLDTSYGARPWWFVCGNCRLSVNEDQKYCPNCGRAIKWE